MEAQEWLATRWSEWSCGDLSSASGKFSPGPSLWELPRTPGLDFGELELAVSVSSSTAEVCAMVVQPVTTRWM